MAVQDFTFPNGIVIAYYGTAVSCRKQMLDANDYKAALAGPAVEAAKWALSPQSGTVIDGTPQRYTSGAGSQTYSGYYGNE